MNRSAKIPRGKFDIAMDSPSSVRSSRGAISRIARRAPGADVPRVLFTSLDSIANSSSKTKSTAARWPACVRMCVCKRAFARSRENRRTEIHSLQSSFCRPRRQRGEVRQARRRSGEIRDSQFPKGHESQWGERRLSLSGEAHSARTPRSPCDTAALSPMHN